MLHFNYGFHTVIFLIQVVLPILHMSLGIFKKLYDMLEESCQDIDVQLFTLCVKHNEVDNPSNNFDQRVKEEYARQLRTKKEREAKLAEMDRIEEELPLYLLQRELQAADGVFKDMANRTFTLKREIQELVICFFIASLNINLCKEHTMCNKLA